MQQRSVSHRLASGYALALQITIRLTFAVAARFSAEAQTTTLTPSSCVSTLSSFTGSCSSIGNTPLQTGTGNIASDEIVLHGQYAGYQALTLPTSVAPSSITGIQVRVNYQGPSHDRQVWTWQLFNWPTNSYVTISDNSAITPSLDWQQWTIFNFKVSGTIANYVRASDGKMLVQIFSNNAADDTFIDYETVIVTASSTSSIVVPLHGVTVADDHDIRTNTYLNQVVTSLDNLSVTPTVRIVYTGGATASSYGPPTQQIKSNRYVMGTVVDSGSMACYTVEDHHLRWQDYISNLSDYVDVWEVGNEINGNWLFGDKGPGCNGTTQADVVTKMTDAYDQAKGNGKATALTLFFNVDSTCAASDPQMIDWANANVPDRMKTGLDYVLVSFYPQWCTSNPYAYTPDWNTVFSTLQSIFPNAKLGMGEIGWDSQLGRPSDNDLITIIQTDYRIHPTTVTNWVGGGFYWEFGLDAVPYDGTPGSIWHVINTELTNQ